MRARAKACGHRVSVTTPKRNGSRNTTGRSYSSISRSVKRSGSVMGRQSFHDALEVADGMRRATQAVGYIVERLHRHDAFVAPHGRLRRMGSEDGRKPHSPWPGPPAFRTVTLPMAIM